jgi:hypothetical protein
MSRLGSCALSESAGITVGWAGQKLLLTGSPAVSLTQRHPPLSQT